MGSEKIASYWNLYDIKTGQLLEEGRKIKGKSWPASGELVVGIPGKLNAIVKDVRLKGIKDTLPEYDVYL
jgi:hypothetical protein